MKNKIEWTVELHNHMVEAFARRMAGANIKQGSKKWMEEQQAFFFGAFAAFEFVNKDVNPGKTCLPGYYFAFLATGWEIQKKILEPIAEARL